MIQFLQRYSLRTCFLGLYIFSLLIISVCNYGLIPYGVYNVPVQLVNLLMVSSLAVYATTDSVLRVKAIRLLFVVCGLNIVAGILPMFFKSLNDFWTLWSLGLPDRLLLLFVLYLLLKKVVLKLKPVVTWMMVLVAYRIFGFALLVGGYGNIGLSPEMALMVNMCISFSLVVVLLILVFQRGTR